MRPVISCSGVHVAGSGFRVFSTCTVPVASWTVESREPSRLKSMSLAGTGKSVSPVSTQVSGCPEVSMAVSFPSVAGSPVDTTTCSVLGRVAASRGLSVPVTWLVPSPVQSVDLQVASAGVEARSVSAVSFFPLCIQRTFTTRAPASRTVSSSRIRPL